jgi:hypothetical protein
MELSAGKLSLDDIINMIGDRMPNQESSAIWQAVVERYASLDNDFLVVWRKNVP